jgi:hypothetical protein
VGTAHADTVIVLAADVQDATAVVDGVLRENRHARVLLPQALWTTGLPERLRGRSRVWFITPAGPPSPTLRQAFTRTFGEPAGPYAQIGYDAMRSVLDTIRRAGARAGNREHLIRTYFAGDGAGAAARRPWWLAQRTTDGGTRYARVTR